MNISKLILYSWVGLGIIGWILLRRKPDKFLFTDPNVLTAVAVLMAFGAPLWGGPIFLIIVLIAPERQICSYCKRAVNKSLDICPNCDHSLSLLPSEYEAQIRKQEQSNQETELLAQKYSKWEVLSLLFFFIFTPVMTIFWRVILVRLSDYRFSLFTPPAYGLYPSSEIWLLPALFLGIVSSAPPMMVVCRLLLGRNYWEYQDYQKKKWPASSNTFAVWFYTIYTGLVLLSIVFLLNTYVLAYPDRIVVNTFFSISEKQYAYGEVQALKSSYQLKNAHWDHPLYVIEFKHGDRWSSRWEDRDSAYLKEMIDYISRQSGIPISPVPAFDDTDV